MAAFGDEVAVFLEPPPPHLGCTLCGKIVAHMPAGINFSFGRQPEPCSHSFCRSCLEAALKSSWGCPTCGDNDVWRVETRWKGVADIVEDRPEIAQEIALLRVHCRHGVKCAEKDVEGGAIWHADDDGCGAVLTLATRATHQRWCFGSPAYERSCLIHAAAYLVCSLALLALQLAWLGPERAACVDAHIKAELFKEANATEMALAARTEEGLRASAAAANEAAEEACAWIRSNGLYATGAVVARGLASLLISHWCLDALLLWTRSAQIARQQRLVLLPQPCPMLPECLSHVLLLAAGGVILFVWLSYDLGKL